MIDRFFEWSLKHRYTVIILFAGLLITGVIAMTRLPIDAVPDITNVSVMVNTKTGALAPEEVEKNITFPVETELAGLPNVVDIRSLSKYGLSQIIVVFSDDTDIYFARQQVAERLQGVTGSLPPGITPELGPIFTGLGEIFMYVLLPKEGSELAKKPEKQRLLYLRTIQDLTVAPVLKTVPGVAEVESNGGFKKQIHINVNAASMDRYGVTCHQLIEKLESLGENYGGGYIQQEGNQVIVRTVGRIENLNQIRQLPVKLNIFGTPVRLNQVATVVDGNELRLGAATYEGNETVLGTVLMRIGANSRNVATDVAKKTSDIKLPDDVTMKVLYNRSFLVNATIDTVTRNLIEGGLLVIAILFLILGNIRAAFIVALAIPMSMIMAFSGMLQSGISASLMSLGAIDFGLIVDGSVVIIENVIRRYEKEGGGKITPDRKFNLTLDACQEVGKPVVLGVFMIMIVYIPILTLTGIEGKMFRPMALTVLYALGASLLIAIFLMPVLSYYFIRIREGEEDKESILGRWMKKTYMPVLTYSLNSRRILIPATLVIAIVSFIMFFNMGSDFIPQLDERDMVIGLVRNTSMGIDESVRQQGISEKVISEFDEVETVFSRMGTPESATDPMGVNFADTFVILKKDFSSWPAIKNGKRRTKQELFAAIKAAVDKKVPGQEISMTQPIEMRFNEILEGSRADITLRIIGPDLDRLMSMVDQASGILEKIEGAESVEMDALTALTRSPVLDVKLDYDKISLYGITIQDVNKSFQVAMSGYDVGYFYQQEKRFPIVVRLSDDFRGSIADISRIPVGLPDGGSIPISRVASIAKKGQVTTIARSRSRRYAAVSIYLRNRDTESFVNEAREKINTGIQFPDGYYAEWGGQFKNLQSARQRLYILIPVILFALFIILIRTFGNFKHALLVFNTIPFAVTGGIIFIYLRGIPFSVSAGVGFIALTGIAILDGMVLVSFFNQLREEGKSVRESVFEGSLTRLRPVIMTSLVAMLGFIPMAFNTGMGAEVQRPLATVVIGGLFTSTILTLLLLPSLYCWLENREELFNLDIKTKDEAY